MSRRIIDEILKVNRIVNCISAILMFLVAIGWVLIIGFTDNLDILGMILGALMAFLPLLWFNWLDKIGWESQRTRDLIAYAKQRKRRRIVYKPIPERKVKYGRF